jgi:hypothetical protein
MSNSSSSVATKVSSVVLLIIFVTLALSLSALILAIQAYNYGNDVVVAYLLLIGFIGVASSTYVLFQTRKRIMRLRIETPPITTTIECKKCGFKSVREFNAVTTFSRKLSHARNATRKGL